MKFLVNALAIGTAGFIGALARYVIALAFNTERFPAGTLLINLSGALVLGFLMATLGPKLPVPEWLKLALTVGFLGAYTTFSSMMYESDAFLRDGSFTKAAAYLVASFTLGLFAARAGWLLGQRF